MLAKIFHTTDKPADQFYNKNQTMRNFLIYLRRLSRGAYIAGKNVDIIKNNPFPSLITFLTIVNKKLNGYPPSLQHPHKHQTTAGTILDETGLLRSQNIADVHVKRHLYLSGFIQGFCFF